MLIVFVRAYLVTLILVLLRVGNTKKSDWVCLWSLVLVCESPYSENVTVTKSCRKKMKIKVFWVEIKDIFW